MKTSGNGIISTTALISPKPRSMGLRNGPLWCIETITYILRLIKQLFDINQKWFQCHQFSAGWRHEQQLQVKSSEHHFGKVETKANTFHTQLLLFSCWVWLFATPWTAARQASLSITNSQSFLKLTLSQWCHPNISSSVSPFSIFPSPQSFPASGSFPVRQFFASGGQSTGASASVFLKNIQGLFPIGLTGSFSSLSKGFSWVFSSTIWKQFFSLTQTIIGTSIPHFQQWIDYPDRKSVRKHWTETIH